MSQFSFNRVSPEGRKLAAFPAGRSASEARKTSWGQRARGAGGLWLSCPCLVALLPGVVRTGAAQIQTAQTANTAQTASLTGQVFSDAGSALADAVIVLTPETGEVPRQQHADSAGEFGFTAVPPGRYQVVVRLQGFTPVTQPVDLQAAQHLVLPPVRLSVATVNFSVDAITPEQAAVEELHTAEHQRLVGVLPNFFVSYNWTAPALTARQKFELSTHNVLDPGNLVLVGVTAGVQQAANAFPGYGQGAAGYGSRYGADLGNLVIGTYMGGAVLPSLFHQDPRYFYKGTGTRKERFLYALSRSVVTRGDNGRNQPNFSGILGDLSAGALSNLYYPASDRQGGTIFFENSILAIAGDAMNDLVQEFVFNHVTKDSRKKHR